MATSLRLSIFCATMLALQPAIADVAVASAAPQARESGANTTDIPTQILKSGVQLNTTTLSPNADQLADQIGLTPLLGRIAGLRASVANAPAHTMERLEARQDLTETIQQAELLITRTKLEVDFVIAEIQAEDEVYQEILATFAADRDKRLAVANASSFVSNGALWAVGESLAIPSAKRAKYAISSGILGIIAGVVPSMFSLYTLRAVNGKKTKSELEPNMLAKLFGYPTNAEIEYPKSVWTFLNQVPANMPGSKTRLDQLIDRWIEDANITAFTHRGAKQQLDVITASVPRSKGLNMDTLTARSVMLEELGAEVMKMKRMLLELTMAVQGEKHHEAHI